jgi:cyclophilin family peptidyl-prolyl cis-trans isomerase
LSSRQAFFNGPKMKIFTLQTEHKKILADTLTPVSAYLKLRDVFPHSLLLESSDYHANNNDFLNHPGQDGWGYCVFGKVIEGSDIVDKIQKVATGNSGGHQDVPIETVTILNVAIN